VKVLVCTVVHNPTDARVFRREIGAILDAGHDVTAIAPWQSTTPGDDRVTRVSVPRAVGRNRLQSLRAARARLRDLGPSHDVVIIHDPELLLAMPWADMRRSQTAVVWDVHEDLAAAILTKAYIPALIRRPLAAAVRIVEAWAEKRCTLLLAEKGYQARFKKQHPLVLNLPYVADSMPAGERLRQAIYVGSITQHRGLGLMIKLANQLAEHNITIRLIGETHNSADADAIRACSNIRWEGALPNAQAMAEVEQSMIGLSLLADIPNYRHSMPTKILEYMASGATVVSTPLPLAIEVLGNDGIVLESFDDSCLPQAVAEIVDLINNADRRRQLTEAGFARVHSEYNWHVAGREFVAVLEAAVLATNRG
jgi:glycosyltransferase involved in cell wall biosynthesis